MKQLGASDRSCRQVIQQLVGLDAVKDEKLKCNLSEEVDLEIRLHGQAKV